MGCHTSVGSTIDKTLGFPRKVDGARGWGYVDLKGIPDAPNRGEKAGEIATYLERVGRGGEFRSNPEMFRWFNADGSLARDRVAAAEDVNALITPSVEPALETNPTTPGMEGVCHPKRTLLNACIGCSRLGCPGKNAVGPTQSTTMDGA